MAKLPTLEQGLAALLARNQSLELVALEPLKTPKEIAEQASAKDITSAKTISQIRDEVLSTYDDNRVGHLLSQYVLSRDTQMATLSGLGAQAILSLIAQGALPAEIAKAIKVSYDTFTEFVRLTCTEQQIKDAEKLGADNLVVDALHDLESAKDKDDVMQARAVMDIKMKIAKTMNTKYVEQKPSTAVQVNNYGSEGGDTASIPFLQIVEPREEDLPPLKPHKAQQTELELPVEPIPLEYALFEPIKD